MTNNDQDYEMCLRAENVFLPQNGYFGVSAATGGLADDHDVLHFLTSSLHPPGQESQTGQSKQCVKQQNLHYGNVVVIFLVPNEDAQKLTQEYQEYQQKLDKQREEYRKEHPDEVKFVIFTIVSTLL